MNADAPSTAMSVWGRRLSYVAFFILAYLAWKADVFWNYYQFKQVCDAQGGLKVYKTLERGVGWEQATFPSLQGAQQQSRLVGVGFVRLKRGRYDPLQALGDGALIDVRYLGGPTLPATSYEMKPADLSRDVVYQVSSRLVDPIPEQQRTNLIAVEIQDTKTKTIHAVYNQLQFRWRTIPIWHWFGPIGTEGCPLSERGKYRKDVLFNQTIFRD